MRTWSLSLGKTHQSSSLALKQTTPWTQDECPDLLCVCYLTDELSQSPTLFCSETLFLGEIQGRDSVVKVC